MTTEKVMTMQLTIKEILPMVEALDVLGKKALPAKTAYRVGKLVRKCLAEVRDYEQSRLKLIQRLGEETDKEKQTWTVKPENLDEFVKEMQDMDAEVVTLEGCAKIDMQTLEKIEIEPIYIAALEPILENT